MLLTPSLLMAMLRSSMLPVLERVYSTATFCPLRALVGERVYVAVNCGAAASVWMVTGTARTTLSSPLPESKLY